MAGVQRPGLSASWELPCAVLCLVAQSCPTLQPHGLYSPPGSSVHGESPGKNTGVGCHALLQGILPTQGSNPGLPHCRRILYHLCHQGRELLYVCVCTRVCACVCARACVCIKAQKTLWCRQNSSAIRLSKNSSAAWETCRKLRFNPWVTKIPWSRKW